MFLNFNRLIFSSKSKKSILFVLLFCSLFSLFLSSSLYAANKNYDHDNGQDVANFVRDVLNGVIEPNATLDNGASALMVAAVINNVELANKFLVLGVDPNLKSNNGLTALECAAQKNYGEMVKLLRDNGAIAFQSQMMLYFNLVNYLVKYSSKGPLFIQDFASIDGYCTGLPSLWLYSKWLNAKSEIKNKYSGTWFKDTVKDIVEWDGISKLPDEKFSEFDNFIDLLERFRNLDLANDFKPTGNNTKLALDEKPLNRKYTIVSVFTREQLFELLNRIVYDDELIQLFYVGSVMHVSALFKHEGMYYFYDPNAQNGEIKEASLEKMVDVIFNAQDKYKPEKNLVLGLVINSFENISHVYPEQNDLLNKMAPPADASALKLAAYIGCLDSLKFFLTRGVDPNHLDTNVNGFTSLMCAAQNGHIELVAELLKKSVNVEQVNSDGWTALMYAAHRGHTEVVARLFKKGANPRHAAADGTTSLMNASQYGHLSIVEMLLHDNRVDPNQQNDKGVTAVMYASLYGHTNVVERLMLDKRVEINHADNTGTTSLMLAASGGHEAIVKILLDNGADCNQKNHYGYSAVEIANQNCARILKNYKAKVLKRNRTYI